MGEEVGLAVVELSGVGVVDENDGPTGGWGGTVAAVVEVIDMEQQSAVQARSEGNEVCRESPCDEG